MALYLKYRPQTFSDIVGQEFIKTTLKTAVAEDKTVWAYLFTGPRGTGKTSSARILAKAINCTNSKDGEPCGKCKICQAFSEESLVDIIEIDAASHTGVDNIREIIEKAQFQPTHTRFKVYIIDEVHMLSKGAFNALLKILEEPPEHIKFILATTEIHKVPETILSRCQRYDFQNFSDEDIKSRLSYIAKNENIQVDDESYEYIVQSAEGGMRNAVSLFEQLIHDGKISYEIIVETLGISSKEQKNQSIQKLLSKDTSILEDIESLRSEGKNLKNFFKEISYQVQEDAKTKIIAGKDISAEITLLETLWKMLREAKQSFDEYFVYTTWILRLLNGWVVSTPPVQQTNKTAPKTEETKKIETVEVATSQQNIETQSEASLEDTMTIFSEKKDSKATLDIQTPHDNRFQKNDFIVSLKGCKAKAAVVMSVQGSKLDIWSGELCITPKTKVGYNTLSKSEHIEVLLESAKKVDDTITHIKILEHVL